MDLRSSGGCIGSTAIGTSRSTRLAKGVVTVVFGLALLAPQGCSVSSISLQRPAQSAGPQGNVHGGQQPIANATIQLYAVGQNGVASSATPLIPGTVLTGNEGQFSIDHLDACPSAATPVYLVSKGGNPGLFAGANPAIALMAALGACGDLNQLPSIMINEVTTVAAVYSLAPFMRSYAEVGMEASLASLFSSSWAQASQLVDVHTGRAPGPNAASFPAEVPVAKINSLANLLAACINSAGGTASQWSVCGRLFADSAAGGSTPSDTVGAMLQIARNPSLKVSSLFGLLAPLAPFEPKLSTAPGDWGLFSSAGISLASPPPVVLPPPIVVVPVPDPAPVEPQPDPLPVAPPLPVAEPTNSVTWYLRHDGAPHYETRLEGSDYHWRGDGPTHTCDGTHDAPWPAIGTRNVLGAISDGRNQPCALAEWRNLYDDQYSYGTLQWIISGSDTVVVDNTQPWRVGWDVGTPGNSTNWCWGRDPYGCFNPTVPPGTADHPTRILGRNYQSCSNSDGSGNHARMSQLFGGFAASTVLNLTGTHDVEVQCIELTQHATCIGHGNPSLPYKCNSDYTQGLPVDDYAGDGILTDIDTQDIVLQNLWIHGMTDRGILGAVGGLITTRGVDLQVNGMAGWDFDPGSSQPSRNAVIIMSHDSIDFSGCNRGADGLPASCYGQNEGGYGDGIGTPGMQGDFYIDHTYFRYNAQDGPDLTHITTGAGHTFSFTNNTSVGNAGAALKWGPTFTLTNIQNNVLVANCNRFASGSLAGTAATYNAHFSTYCRANNGTGGGQYNHGHVIYAHNTLVNYFPTSLDPQCNDPRSCADAVFDFNYNIFRGYDNPATYGNGGQTGGPGIFCGYLCDNTTVPLGTFNRHRNWYYGTRQDNSRPNVLTGYAISETATDEVGGVDPQFVYAPSANGSSFDEVQMDNLNTTLAGGSPATGLGASISNAPASLLSIEAPPITLVGPGVSQRIMPVVHYSDYSMLPVKPSACVSSSPAVVFVTAPCTLSALAVGDAVITLTYSTLPPAIFHATVVGTASDSFTASSLGSKWTIDQGSFTSGGGSVSGNGNSYARYTGAEFANDQTSCATFGATTNSGDAGVAVRWHSNMTGYRMALANNVFKLMRQDGPATFTTLIASPQNVLLGHNNSNIDYVHGSDEVCLNVTGHTLSVYANGMMATTPVDDSTYEEGEPALFSEGSNSNTITLFKAYPLSASLQTRSRTTSSATEYGTRADVTQAR